MKLKIEISMDNAAFEDAPMSEVARILRRYADQLEQLGNPDETLRDINGNYVGAAVLIGARV